MEGADQRSPVDRVNAWIGDRMGVLFLLSAILTGYEVMASAAFRAPTIWVHDLTTMLCCACFLMGGAYALQRREHIRITPIYDLMPAVLRRIADLIAGSLTLFYLAVLTWFTFETALESIQIGEMSGHAWDFPMPVVIRSVFFLGSLMLLLQAGVQTWALVRPSPGDSP